MEPSWTTNIDKLLPKDDRVQHKFATLNGVKYHYLYASPSNLHSSTSHSHNTSRPRGTIFLIHGWPDISFGWRCQIPYLLSLNFRVIAPDMIGYGQTEAPQDLSYYTFKRAADDMAELARQLDIPKITLIGHDWGGAIVYRIALWKPELIQSVIAVCTPYSRPSLEYVSTEEMVKKYLPQFQYQLHLASGEIEENIKSREEVKHFVNSLYGARREDGTPGFDVRKGADFAVIKSGKLVRTSLMNAEEWEYYADQFAITGVRGGCNWYRTRKLNYDEEIPLAKLQQEKGLKVKPPTLFIGASRDVALPPAMARGMGQNFENLKMAQVDGGHWILVQKAEECNKLIGDYLNEVIPKADAGTKSKI